MTHTIHLTNWSSTKLHGPGQRLSIMCRPRIWERGAGRVIQCTPDKEVFDALRLGQVTLGAYRASLEEQLTALAPQLAPGILPFVTWPSREGRELRTGLVVSGDTLLCACAREVAAQGKCHRVWCAEHLARAGWSVILDGRSVVVT